MNVILTTASVFLLLIAGVGAFYMLRGRDTTFSRRLPGVLEICVPLFLFGVAILPTAIPSVFASILHHSINAEYIYPLRTDGMRVTDTWLLARWWAPIQRVHQA